MIDLTFLNHYAPVWILVILVVLFYAALSILKVPGSKWVLALTSLLIAFIFVSSKTATNFIIDVIPVITVLMVVGFMILVMLALVMKDLSTFAKPLAWISFVLAILIVLSMAFSSFPTLNHMLPHTPDSGLNPGLEQLKEFIYSHDFKDTLVFVVSIIVVCFFLIKTK